MIYLMDFYKFPPLSEVKDCFFFDRTIIMLGMDEPKIGQNEDYDEKGNFGGDFFKFVLFI